MGHIEREVSPESQVEKSDKADDHNSPPYDPSGGFENQDNSQKAADGIEDIWNSSAEAYVLILDKDINTNEEREDEKRNVNDREAPVFFSDLHLPSFITPWLKGEEKKDKAESKGEMDGPLLNTG
jgi:hypothetical protein